MPKGHPPPWWWRPPAAPVPLLSLGCCEHVQGRERGLPPSPTACPTAPSTWPSRGTDDSLAGWKVLRPGYTTVAQKLAPGVPDSSGPPVPRQARVGATPGGNLAVWAAVHAPPWSAERILQVISNDGPRLLAGTSPPPGPTRSWQTGSSPTSPGLPWWAPSSTRTPGPGLSEPRRAKHRGPAPSPGRSRLALSPPTAPAGRVGLGYPVELSQGWADSARCGGVRLPPCRRRSGGICCGLFGAC